MIASLAACSEISDAEYRAEIVLLVHQTISAEIDLLIEAAHNLQADSPSLAWNPVEDAAAITEMRDAWMRARTAYEHIEGPVGALFPEVAVALDGRYEQLLARIGAAGDPNAFDARGFTGMHAIERILFSPEIRNEVFAFEVKLPGFRPAAYPETDEDAISFKTVLVQRLIDDLLALRKQWRPAAIDLGTAYRGLMELMHEQKDKVNRAVTGEEESRYANVTLFDLRNNIDGTHQVYGIFRDWILSKTAADRPDAVVQRRLGELAALYATAQSHALPAAPDDWAAQPTDANLATPFGAMWKTVHEAVDPSIDGSVVFEMNRIAAILGLPQFVEQ